MFWLIFAELVKILFQCLDVVFKVLGFVFGMVLNLWGSFGGCFYSSGTDLGVLLKTLMSFWIVLDPGRFQQRIYSMMLTSFSRFWIDFGAILDLFWISKSRKRGPKSISKTNQVFDVDFHEFWLILYRYVNRKSLKTIGFYSVSLSSCFWYKLVL